MPSVNLGRVRGSQWYFGDGIDGKSTVPDIYPESGVGQAYEKDMYLSGSGDVYQCVSPGKPEEAEWIYACSIKGNMPELEHGLHSSSRTKALSAYAGRLLYEKMIDSGIYTKEIEVFCEEKVFLVKLTCENCDTEITFTTDTERTGVYRYTSGSDAETAEIAIAIGSSIGLSPGSILTNVKSSKAYILECILYDSDGNIIETITPSIWDEILELQKEISGIFLITEESGEGTIEEYRASQIKKLIHGIWREIFPVTHVKSVWWNRLDNISLYDKINEITMNCYQKSDEITEANVDAIISGTYDSENDNGEEESGSGSGTTGVEEITDKEIDEIIENLF